VSPVVWQEEQSLHYAPPDFLLRLVALMNFMRLSPRRAAHVAIVSRREVGNPGTLSGQDDNSVLDRRSKKGRRLPQEGLEKAAGRTADPSASLGMTRGEG
jgi:hypothetical protein